MKKKLFKKNLQKVLETLGLVGKKELTSQDWNKISASYKKLFGVELNAALADTEDDEPTEAALTAELRQQALDLLGADEDPDEEEEEKTDEEEEPAEEPNDDDEDEEEEEKKPAGKKKGKKSAKKKAQSTQQIVQGLVHKVNAQGKTIKTLAAEPEVVQTPKVKMEAAAAANRVLGRTAHTATHLFGIEDPFFARDKWWNNITATRKEVQEEAMSTTAKEEFKVAFLAYTESLKKRTKQLSDDNLLGALDYKQIAAGESTVDYSDLFNKAGEYIVRRQDAIIAFMRTLPSVGHIFPVVSNIQNKEIAPGANFGELSQGYRSGRIFKGNVSFTAEIYSVVDVMFKFKFTDLIRLEKQYIGYLNREGSDVIKWTFIEWIIVHFGEILLSEQNRRRVVGVRVPQQNVVANPAVLAADGALRAIERVEEQLKVLPFEDLKRYDEATILDYIENFYAEVEAILPTMDGMKVYANAKHKRWYLRLFREKYGKDTDFAGTKDSIIDVLEPGNIIWVPNMEMNCFKMWITKPNNVESYEDKPHEMLAFYFERDFEDILTMSRWKEGSGLQMAGIQYKTAAELIAAGRVNQWIFTNWPVVELAAGATTADGKLGTLFQTSANAAATALTNITNASVEEVYKIVCGSPTHATTIAKAGKFANIKSAWTPTAKGDYIKLYAELEDYQDTVEIDGEQVNITRTRHTGNFLELERKVTPAPAPQE